MCFLKPRINNLRICPSGAKLTLINSTMSNSMLEHLRASLEQSEVIKRAIVETLHEKASNVNIAFIVLA